MPMIEDERRRNAGFIINTAAVASAGAAAVLSKRSILGALIKADTPVLATIAISMVIALGKLFDQNIGSTAAITLLSKYIGSSLGVAGTKSIVGWVPIIGRVANATITFGFIEALGWQIYDYFDKEYEGKVTQPKRSTRAGRIPIYEKMPAAERTPVTKKIPVT